MTKATRAGSVWKDWGVAMLCVGIVLAFLFRQSFQPEKVLFSNDAPLGLISSKAGVTASSFEGIVSGFWQDLNWIGIEMPSVMPDLTWGMFQLFGRDPVTNAKFLTPVSFLFLGFAAWFLFRTLGFRQIVCVIGALAAALNMNSFSHGAWGLPGRAMSWGVALLAIAGLYSGLRGRPWMKAALAGMCVGLGIVEAFDVGALYSLYIAAFGVFLAFAKSESREYAKGVARVVVVAIFAALFAAQALVTLIGTQVKGIAGLQQDAESRSKHWDEATAWSLPKTEILRVAIPGLFGYRMDTPEGGAYWGSVGFPAYQRHSGAGEYAGILVVLVGIWGAANAFRKKNPLYSELERRIVIFWTLAAIVSVLFAWGRWAPFYQLIYHLPFFSTIRNPIKFMHFFHLSLLILFGYGLELIFRHYVNATAAKSTGPMEQFKIWWGKAAPFDRRIVLLFGAGLVVSLFGFMMYSTSTKQLAAYLQTVGFKAEETADIATFSVHEVGSYLIFLVASLAVMALCLSGFFSGPRARLAGWIIGGLLAVDLGRANTPWIIYYNYKERYVSNPVLDLLRKDTPGPRVTMRITPFSGQPLAPPNSQAGGALVGLSSEWLQNQFQYYNIPSPDIVQMPRVPEMDAAFRSALWPSNGLPSCARLWQLSNTRYLIGEQSYLTYLNHGYDPALHRFQILTNFQYKPKPGVTDVHEITDLDWELAPNGPFSVFEFTGALPRYKLFTQWRVVSDEDAALKTISSPAFDPLQEVVVMDTSVKASTGSTNTGTVQLLSYAPKKMEMKTETTAPTILLWSDRWSPNWNASIDGQPVKLMRCNYIMRGVEVPAGSHVVEMHFAQSAQALWISFATMFVGIGLCLFLAFEGRKRQA